MDRRDALKSLASVVAATGMTVTPVTAQDAQGVEVVMLKLKHHCSQDTVARIKAYWAQAMQGTSLEHTKTVVFHDDEISVEFVRTK